jgi:hypothetical protein
MAHGRWKDVFDTVHRLECYPMPLDPKRVQAAFLEAAYYHHAADRAAVLDRECSDDLALRGRIEQLLKAHDQWNRFLNDSAGDFGLAMDIWAESNAERAAAGPVDVPSNETTPKP